MNSQEDIQAYANGNQIQIELSQYNKLSKESSMYRFGRMDEYDAQLELQAVHQET